MLEIVRMQKIPYFLALSIFSIDIHNEEKKNIETINYNHSTKLSPEKVKQLSHVLFFSTKFCVT